MARDPNWNWDETVLALDFYVRHHPQPPGENSVEIGELSALLNRMAEQRGVERTGKFRNRAGVYMKLMNFRRHDPEFLDSGRSGLARGATLEDDVFQRYWLDRRGLNAEANSIRNMVSAGYLPDLEVTDEEVEAAEGALTMVAHRSRERSRALANRKRKTVLAATGTVACEVCGFDFGARYGERGTGFIEIHHNAPIASLLPGSRTKLSDLACVCSNCHRMLHRGGILTVAQLREMLR